MKADVRSSRPQQGAVGSSMYLYSWIAVAACGLAYVGVAATRPDIIATVLPLAEPSSEQAFGNRAAADMSDELATLRKWVHDMQHELASTKSALHDQVQQNSTLMQRISAAEERLPPVRETRVEAAAKAAASVRAKPTPQPVAPVPQVAAPQPGVPVAGVPQTVAVAGSDAAGYRVINSAGTPTVAAPSAPITTGSVNPAPVAVPAASAPPAPKTGAAPPRPRGIEIGSSDSLDNLRSRWSDIASRNPDALGDAAPRYRIATDGRPAPFTLVAGPFGTTEDAIRTCSQLRSKGVTCRVSDFTGSAF